MLNKQNTINSQLVITSYGLESVAGNQDFALFGAVAARLSCAAEDANHVVASPSGKGFDAALTAAMPKFSVFGPTDRLQLSLEGAISHAAEFLLNSKLEQKKHLILIVLPAERCNFIDKKEWQKSIQAELEQFSDLHFSFLKSDANVVKHLQIVSEKLNSNEFNSVLFAASDSLLDQLTIDILNEQKRLCSAALSDGLIPGEAAACVVIQKMDAKLDPRSQHVRAIIKGLAHVDEPNTGKADKKSLAGLGLAIKLASENAGQHPDNIDCVVRTGVTERRSAMEWLQTTNTVWPNTLPEQLRVAYQIGELDEPPKLKPRKMPEELDVSLALGEIGAASIPLGLVLACARFDFQYPSVNNCLVFEANDNPFRGAIFLDNPNAGYP
ncbi:hypothetical protein MNBD_GAMMA22-1166 [hydrothermal vent metagenome]|uniref:Uncharacterized protein n=1 Tax=hydrothermal vent metagenome TaxID=652676 RepID=A0A3B1ADH2_9ZZZZ